MTNPTPHGQVPEALEDFQVRKLAAIGAVHTSSGLVERRPIEYRRELEDQFVRGFRAAEKLLSALSAAPTITPETGNATSAQGAAITSESGAPPAHPRRTSGTPPAEQPIGEVVVTKTRDGQIVSVTRQDDEGRILSVIATSDPEEQSQPHYSHLHDADAVHGKRLSVYSKPTAEQQAQPGAVYAELPAPTASIGTDDAWHEPAMRDFADRTHALRMQAAPKAAPEAIAKLRHLYQNMVNGAVRDTASAKRIADGLLAPAIEALERATPPAEQAAPKTEALEQAARLALETLERASDSGFSVECDESIAALRKALEQAAPKAAPGEQDDHQILAITTAYEQGVGKGHQAYNSGKEIANPYSPAYRCDLAWQYGYKEGKEQAQREAKAAPQQEAQEPVMIYHGRCTIDCGEHGHHDVELLRMIPAGSKLYTAPQPAPAPLTDAQIAEMMRDTWGCASIAPRHAIGFARAVEAAHGIGIKGGQHGTDTRSN